MGQKLRSILKGEEIEEGINVVSQEQIHKEDAGDQKP